MAMLHPGNAGPNSIPAMADQVQLPDAVLQIPSIQVLDFWVEYKYKAGFDLSTHNMEDGPPPHVEEHWVKWVKKGEQGGSVVQESVKRYMPNPAKNRPAAPEWQVIEPAYNAWLKGEVAPLNGTALSSWSGLSRDMAEQLKRFNIFTIEDLADFPDHKTNQVPLPGLLEYRRRAKAWVQARDVSDTGALLAERDRTILEQGNLIKDMQAQMATMQSDFSKIKIKAGAAADELNKVTEIDDEYVQIKKGEDVSKSPPPRAKSKR